MPDADVGFGRVSLRRWSKAEFLEYCEKQCLQDSEDLYDRLSDRVKPDHPLLTRAVLVKRVVELAKASGSEFVNTLPTQTTNEFKWLVERVLEREATEKWVNKFGDPPSPLLSVEQHEELLCLVAEEMWVSKTAALSYRLLDTIADNYSEQERMAPQVVRQVRERLVQHALLASLGPLRKEIAFDHDHFRQFFLGQTLARHIAEQRLSDVRKIFRTDYLPEFALDAAAAELRERNLDAGAIIGWISTASASEGTSSFVRENAGAVIIRILELIEAVANVADVIFPVDSLKARTLRGAQFARCYFQATSLNNSVFENCIFEDCEIERVEYEHAPTVVNSSLTRGTKIHSISRLSGTDMSDVYDPEKIKSQLARLGFTLEGPVSAAVAQEEEPGWKPAGRNMDWERLLPGLHER